MTFENADIWAKKTGKYVYASSVQILRTMQNLRGTICKSNNVFTFNRQCVCSDQETDFCHGHALKIKQKELLSSSNIMLFNFLDSIDKMNLGGGELCDLTLTHIESLCQLSFMPFT